MQISCAYTLCASVFSFFGENRQNVDFDEKKPFRQRAMYRLADIGHIVKQYTLSKFQIRAALNFLSGAVPRAKTPHQPRVEFRPQRGSVSGSSVRELCVPAGLPDEGSKSARLSWTTVDSSWLFGKCFLSVALKRLLEGIAGESTSWPLTSGGPRESRTGSNCGTRIRGWSGVVAEHSDENAGGDGGHTHADATHGDQSQSGEVGGPRCIHVALTVERLRSDGEDDRGNSTEWNDQRQQSSACHELPQTNKNTHTQYTSRRLRIILMIFTKNGPFRPYFNKKN